MEITLHAKYSEATATVRATHLQGNRYWISAQAHASARKRASLIGGDYFREVSSYGYRKSDGFLVEI